MENTWSIQRVLLDSCVPGLGMCVSLDHGLVIIANYDDDDRWEDEGCSVLYVHSPTDGSLVRRIGGSEEGQFEWGCGGMCVCPDGDSVLVADTDNDRVQQVRIMDGSRVRCIGEGVLAQPSCVDCNTDVIAVSEDCHRISVLSWADGSALAQFGSYGSGPGQLKYPRGVRLLADGSGLVVADYWNHRLCVFALSGKFVAGLGSRGHGLYFPHDVLECASGDSFVVANYGGHNLVKLGRDGAKVGYYDNKCVCPTALAALPDGGMVVRECKGARFQVFRDLELRKAWVTACVAGAREA